MNMHFHFLNQPFYLVMSCLFMLCNGCGSNPKVPTPKVTSKTQSVQKELGPILGPITKAKVIDRLEGYPVCGMKSEPQKQTLILRFHALGKTVESSKHTVIEVECFFLGFQGLFEYYALEHQTGTLRDSHTITRRYFQTFSRRAVACGIQRFRRSAVRTSDCEETKRE